MRSRGVILIGAGVIVGGYTFVWMGMLMIRGFTGPGRPTGPGLLDLILPSRAVPMSAKIKAGPPGTGPSSTADAQRAAAVAGGAAVSPSGGVAPGTKIDPGTGKIYPPGFKPPPLGGKPILSLP